MLLRGICFKQLVLFSKTQLYAGSDCKYYRVKLQQQLVL
jgi:hypothetical protein